MWNRILIQSLHDHQKRLAVAAAATTAAGWMTTREESIRNTISTAEEGHEGMGYENNDDMYAAIFKYYVNSNISYSNNYKTFAESKKPIQSEPKKMPTKKIGDNTKKEEESDEITDEDWFGENQREGSEDDDEEDDDDDDDDEKSPWWGKRLTRRLTRHFTRQSFRNTPTDDKPKSRKGGDATKNKNKKEDSDPKMTSDDKLLFEGQCLKRQLYTPRVPYPAWDYNWDGRMTPDTSLEGHKSGKASSANSDNKTRHIILVRHGQYDEYPKDDINRKLTPLGRKQAKKTGQRLAEIAKGSYRFRDAGSRGPCPIKVIRSSNMRRAQETAELIAKEMQKILKDQKINLEGPDPDLDEALPAPMCPVRPELSWATDEIDQHRDRVERTFLKYFYRDTKPEAANADAADGGNGSDGDNDKTKDGEGKKKESPASGPPEEIDEFEVIVCHGNVIRYLFCRALQLPPEAWLRLSLFNCSLTYLMIRPNGMVTARMLGDIGHLTYEESTFSSNYGFKW